MLYKNSGTLRNIYIILSLLIFGLTGLSLFDFSIEETKLLISRIERLLAFCFAAIALIFFARHIRKKYAFQINPTADVASTPNYPKPWQLYALPVPFLIYQLLFFIYIYYNHQIPEPDYSGISSALNSTIRGDGILRTTFFQTGQSDTFLAHHFSPTLLLLLPFYSIAQLFDNATHLMYGFLIILILALGVYSWIKCFRLHSPDTDINLLLTFALITGYPLLRLASSYHFEIFVIPLSALLFSAVARQHKGLLLFSLILWLGVKEDCALYLLFYGVYLITCKSSRDQGMVIATLSTLYFIIINFYLKEALFGNEVPHWNYWETVNFSSLNFATASGILLSVAFLPLFNYKYFILVILPIQILHLFSNHPWHSDYYGHYSYSILPFLLIGSAQGLMKLEVLLRRFRLPLRPALWFATALILYSATGDRETPPPLSKHNTGYESFSVIINKLPSDDYCLQTQPRFYAHTPLRAQLIPLYIPKNNPLSKQLDILQQSNSNDINNVSCRKHYLLLEARRSDGFFSVEQIDSIVKEARQRFSLRHQLQDLILFQKWL